MQLAVEAFDPHRYQPSKRSGVSSYVITRGRSCQLASLRTLFAQFDLQFLELSASVVELVTPLHADHAQRPPDALQTGCLLRSRCFISHGLSKDGWAQVVVVSSGF